ncbi:MAG: hypothetical protein ABH804_00805 [archaeon]
MKKFFIITLTLLIIVGAVYSYVYFLNKEPDISGLPDYYRNLAEECKENYPDGYNCCISSVMNMADGNYLLAPGETLADSECPEGHKPNTLKCIGSFIWCEPV